jgi:hypothetical protein
VAEQQRLGQLAGIATQFTGMNGADARGLLQWIARATSSLPVRLSPVISTLVPAN